MIMRAASPVSSSMSAPRSGMSVVATATATRRSSMPSSAKPTSSPSAWDCGAKASVVACVAHSRAPDGVAMVNSHSPLAPLLVSMTEPGRPLVTALSMPSAHFQTSPAAW